MKRDDTVKVLSVFYLDNDTIPVYRMKRDGKESFVRSMEVKRDEVYSLILQEMSTLDNFISRKIKVVYHRNCYRKYTSKQNCSVFKTDQIKFYKY